MSDCESIRDRIPLVANALAEWTVEDASHLAGCPECAAEWRVVEAARRLGEVAASRVDVGRVDRAVQARLASTRVSAGWRPGNWIAGLAAAAAIVLVVRLAVVRSPQAAPIPEAASTALHVPLAELESLDTEELETVLEGLGEPIGTGAAPDVPRLGDLDDVQLERVLRSLEG